MSDEHLTSNGCCKCHALAEARLSEIRELPLDPAVVERLRAVVGGRRNAVDGLKSQLEAELSKVLDKRKPIKGGGNDLLDHAREATDV